MESKVCPLSMGGEITECVGEDCMAMVDGECCINRISLSLYLIAKNTNDIKKENERIRRGR